MVNKYATPLEMLKAFLQDPDAWDMFIEGPAGTGKTVSLCELVDWCIQDAIDENGDARPRYSIVVCAHTHKACGVLRKTFAAAGLGHIAVVTLHSFLNKRPTINTDANHIQHLESSVQTAKAEAVEIVFIDEFSMVGEKDLMDLRALQDPEYEGDPVTRLVWIGDPFQLPPVKDQQSVIPHDPYHYRLTEVRRTDGPLLKIMAQLVDMLQGGELKPIKPNAAFHRKADLDQVFEDMKFQKQDVAVLAYTNKAVQDWNARLEGKEEPELGDWLFCHTLHRRMQLLDIIEPSQVTSVDRIFAEPLTLNSKYKTLEFLIDQSMCHFYRVADEDCTEYLLPAIFGTYDYKVLRDRLGKEAVASNGAIEKECGARNATEWSKLHPLHPLSRKRALAWRKYLTFKEVIQGFDFSHAMTIHKSQGSTFENVLLDSADLNLCRLKNFNMYLRLFYVGVSRASQEVYCND